ncbi:protein CHROMATIN REMODELING 35 isoform X2 [Raphanus sativus]|uniref:Protein CHROMATIN REMODELING 35 isoform X2 n=1 Tax=Raphanus sativus TaxID=3726 RepID=A0A9W3DJU4_RAPSA|nr:protein CHROMATIN REMODELING 35 isoform X2 [Raphanus sativus]
MAFSQESSAQVKVENSQDNEFKQKEECEHSFIYRDDTGEVCCVCGLINRHIARMIEFVFNKSGDSSESELSPQGYNGGNGTHMYGVGEEEEAQLWREMAFAQESFQIDDCVHSFIFKDDIGEVCCVCGLIKRHIARMIEFEFNKDDMLLL